VTAPGPKSGDSMIECGNKMAEGIKNRITKKDKKSTKKAMLFP